MKNLLMLTLVLAAFYGCQTASIAQADGYTVGSDAIDFNLKNATNNGPGMDKMVSIATLTEATKGAIVIFTCNHCPFSVAYEDRIIALHKAFAPKGFPVIAINPNDPARVPEDSFDEMKKRATAKAFPFTYVFDETQAIAKAYGAKKTPHVYLVVKEGGKLKVAYIGAIDDDSENQNITAKYTENAVNAVLTGSKPFLPETKAIGCTIKWKTM